MEKKRRHSDRWNRFTDMFYATQQGVDKRKRQAYIETIQPEKARKNLEMKTNLNQLEELKRQQQQAQPLKQGESRGGK